MTDPQPPHPPRPETPLEPLTSELNLRPSAGLPWLICLVVVAGGVWLFLTGQLHLGTSPSAPITLREMETSAKKNAGFSDSEERRLVQLSWRELQTQLHATAKRHAELSQTLDRLLQRIQELQQSDEGRRIAAHDELVDLFLTVVSRAHPSAEQLQTWQEVLQALEQNCDEALKDSHLLMEPSDKAQQRAQATEQAIVVELKAAREDGNALQALVRRAAGNPPDQLSLAEAVVSLDERRQADRTAELTAARRAVEREAQEQKKAQEVIAERKRQEAALEEQKIADELKAVAAKAKNDRERQLLRETQEKLAAEQAHQEQLRKFDKALPEIKSLLSPMISKGKMQLGTRGWVAGEEGPLSLAALKSAGVLDLRENGYYNVVSFFMGPSCPNDRPRGSLPTTLAGYETKLRHAQELLVEFGDILVEKGMLRP